MSLYWYVMSQASETIGWRRTIVISWVDGALAKLVQMHTFSLHIKLWRGFSARCPHSSVVANSTTRKNQPGHIVRLAFGSPNLLISVFPLLLLVKAISLTTGSLFFLSRFLVFFIVTCLPPLTPPLTSLRGQPGHIVRLMAFTYPFLVPTFPSLSLLSLFSFPSPFLLLPPPSPLSLFVSISLKVLAQSGFAQRGSTPW